jgi:deoxyribonuclease-4
MNIKYIVVHPGNTLTNTKEVAINNIIEALNIVINKNTKCMILIETMAGKGTECASNIEEVKMILDGIEEKDKIGVCLDTCHINDAGYDLLKYIDEFDNVIGIEKVKCVHVNDSKNIKGAHKDRHENIGYGELGFDNILNVIYHEKLKNVPINDNRFNTNPATVGITINVLLERPFNALIVPNENVIGVIKFIMIPLKP